MYCLSLVIFEYEYYGKHFSRVLSKIRYNNYIAIYKYLQLASLVLEVPDARIVATLSIDKKVSGNHCTLCS